MAGTITHSWNGTILTITSDSGTTAMDLKGEKGDTGARGARGLPGKAGGGARIEDGVISDETTWSSSGIIDRFAELMGTNANPAVLDNPYPNFPLQITTTFEPKQEGSGEPSPSNIRLISGFNNAKLTRCGKNLAKSINSTNITGIYGTSLFIDTDLKPSTTYTLSFVATAGNLLFVNNNISEYQEISTSGNRQSITFTTKSTISTDDWEQYDSEKGWIIFKNAGDLSTPTVFTDVQLELGSTATEYEPYQGNTYTADFGQTISNGMLDWNTGVLTVEWGYKAFDGTEEWTKAESDKNYFYTPMNTLGKTDDYITSIKCSTFRTADSHMYLPGNVGISGFYDIRNSYPGVNWIYINNGVSTTAAELKEWLSAQHAAGTPVQVCYKLATPQIIQLTPQEIKAIKGINTLYSNAQELTVIGRVDTMYQLSKLAERVAALESR